MMGWVERVHLVGDGCAQGVVDYWVIVSTIIDDHANC